MEKDIYKLKLHEIMCFEQGIILRVAGGWIYKDMSGSGASQVFVPFDNEFKDQNPNN